MKRLAATSETTSKERRRMKARTRASKNSRRAPIPQTVIKIRRSSTLKALMYFFSWHKLKRRGNKRSRIASGKRTSSKRGRSRTER